MEHIRVKAYFELFSARAAAGTIHEVAPTIEERGDLRVAIDHDTWNLGSESELDDF
jgi:hypothetical protein